MTNLDQDGVAGDYERKDQYHVLEWKIFLGRLSRFIITDNWRTFLGGDVIATNQLAY